MHKQTAPRQQPPHIDVSAYRGQWVAVHRDTYEVIGHGDTPDKAVDEAVASSETPLLFFVPNSEAFFVGPSA